MAHGNARTTVFARRLIVERSALGGRPRGSLSNWVFPAPRCTSGSAVAPGGGAGLADRSCRPMSSPPGQPSGGGEDPAPGADAYRGPVFLAAELGLTASTVGRVLRRHQVPPLAAIDPITGAPVRRAALRDPLRTSPAR